MADKYPDFDTLSRHETAGVDYQILARRSRAGFAIVAPHGGGIEPGTSEIADAIGLADYSSTRWTDSSSPATAACTSPAHGSTSRYAWNEPGPKSS